MPVAIVASAIAALTANADVDKRQIVAQGATPGGIVATIQANALGKTVSVVEPSRHLSGLTAGGPECDLREVRSGTVSEQMLCRGDR
jgi:hypothetical protein